MSAPPPSLRVSSRSTYSRRDLKCAREEIGYRLFLEALAKDDPLRAEIEAQDATSEALRAELAALARDNARPTNEEVRTLCDHLARREAPEQCAVATAGALLESMLVPRRHVVGAHVEGHLGAAPRLRVFVYVHTHNFEEGWPLEVPGGTEVTVHNTGAFQRTVDEEGLPALVAQKNLAPGDALRKIGGARDLLIVRRSRVEDVALAPGGRRHRSLGRAWQQPLQLNSVETSRSLTSRRCARTIHWRGYASAVINLHHHG
jgi:hypothetical protein